MIRLLRAVRRVVHRWWDGSARRDVDEEFEFHIEEETRYNRSLGMSQREARRMALRAFGSRDVYRDSVLTIGRVPLLEPVLRDVLMALRTLRSRPVQSVTSVVTLALGVGAGAVVLSMLRGVTSSTLPVPDAHDIVFIDRWTTEDGPERSLGVFAHDVMELQESLQSLAALGAAVQGSFVLGGVEEPTRVVGAAMSPEMFDVAAEPAAMGRVFRDSDVSVSPRPVVVSWRVWEDQLGRDPAVIGRDVLVDGGPAQVIGVMPEAFVFPTTAELWVPLDLAAMLATPRDQAPELFAMGRLVPGRSLSDVASELSSTRDPAGARAADRAVGVRERVRVFTAEVWSGSDFVQTFRILWAITISFLAVAILNVANLRYAAFLGRGSELSLRRSLGAGRIALVRLLALESLVVAVVGGALGLGLAVLVVQRLSLSMVVIELPSWISLVPDWGTVAFVVVVVLVALPVAGIVPALRATPRVARTVSRGALGLGARSLVLVQVAVSMALLFSAAIAARSLTDFSDRPLGFEPTGVTTARTLLTPRAYQTSSERIEFLDAFSAEATALGVSRFAVASSLPPEGAARLTYLREGATHEGRLPTVRRVIASEGYFGTLGVDLLAGRGMRSTDSVGAAPVVIVNRAFAEREWGGVDDVVGRRIRLGASETDAWAEVVGVVPNLQHTPFDFEKHPMLYLSWRQYPTTSISLLVGSTDPTLPRQLVSSVDPELALWEDRPLRRVVEESRLVGGVVTALFSSLAALATVLAAFGLYAVLAYWGNARTPEIGVRLALGARPSAIARWIGWCGARLVVPGLAVGVALAIGCSRLFALAFPEIDTFPAVDLIVILCVLLLASLAALAAPAWRAARVAPSHALRAGQGAGRASLG